MQGLRLSRIAARKQAKGGAYLLVLRLGSSKEIRVGSLGAIRFPEGTYVYAGSALNSLESRVERHFSLRKKEHWHIDLLRSKARPIEALVLRSQDRLECLLNDLVDHMEGARAFAAGFGCSDCACSTHLHIVDDKVLQELEDFFPERMLPGSLAGE